MSLIKFNLRSEERHPVSWESVLYVQFPDKEYHLKITVANISTQGALLLSDQIFIDNEPLISNHRQNRLALITQLQDVSFRIPVEIRWYQWSVKKNLYEIGVKFAGDRNFLRKQIDPLIQMFHKIPGQL